MGILVNTLRTVLIALIILHICKKSFKPAKNATLVFVLTFFPALLAEIFGVIIDPIGESLYHIIVFAAIYLGGTHGFYDKYSWWDMMIHFLSGIAFVSFGVALSIHAAALSRMSILFFCLTLSVFLHVIWEIAEYICDSFMRTNHQRWQKHHYSVNHKSESAIQTAGLVDTMNDTIICISGTLTACIAWWFIL
ncbi:MAG: hypothetical protein FWG90_13575 [Oscillospiraceae bacterium]|nr:hypothetical protein [Oscillospiraceae bacterium]